MTPLEVKLKEIQERCIQTSKKMAALELSVWDKKHETELKEHFGFNDKTLAKRKTTLQKAI